MNPRTLLLTPWRATHSSLQWVVLGLFALGLATGMAVALAVPTPEGARIALVAYEFSAAFLWAFFMPASFLLAYDARQLRMPRLEATAIAGICLIALLTIAIAVALIGPAFGIATVAALTALVVTAGFAFSLLPSRLGVFIGLLPVATDALRRVMPIPTLTDAHAPWWSCGAALVFGLACVMRWRQLIRQDPETAGRSGALVMQMRRNGGAGGWNTAAIKSDRALRQRPNWLQGEADLRGSGPSSPVTSLRIALGGWFVPQTWRGRFRQSLGVAGPFAMFGLVMVLIHASTPHPGHWHDALEGFAFGAGGVLYLSITLFLPLISTLMLRHRWSTPQRELALLGVLPGLGTPMQARRSLLQAALSTPLTVNVVLGVLCLVMADALKLSNVATLALAGGPTLGLLAGVALTLDALGSRPIRGWALGLVCSVLVSFVLSSGLTALLATQLQNRGALSVSPVVWSAFGGMALVLVAMLAWVGLRGARTMLAQPHPFLAHA